MENTGTENVQFKSLLSLNIELLLFLYTVYKAGVLEK